MHKRLAISIYSETKPKDINFHALYCIANMDPMVIKNINKQIKQIAIGKPVIVKFSRYNDYEHGELTSGEAEAAVKNLIVLNTRLVALQQWSPRRETKEIIERWEYWANNDMNGSVYDLNNIHQMYSAYIESEIMYLEELIHDITEFNTALKQQ